MRISSSPCEVKDGRLIMTKKIIIFKFWQSTTRVNCYNLNVALWKSLPDFCHQIKKMANSSLKSSQISPSYLASNCPIDHQINYARKIIFYWDDDLPKKRGISICRWKSIVITSGWWEFNLFKITEECFNKARSLLDDDDDVPLFGI